MLTKRFMYAEPRAWHELMRRLAELVGNYLAAQARAGARALQLFDSWVGCLSPADYATYVFPHSQRALELEIHERRTADSLRDGHGHTARGFRAGGGRRDRHRLAGPAGRR